MPMPCHLYLEGEKQGVIDGSCEMAGREKSILVEEYHHSVLIPHDPQSGGPTGQRVHQPFTIVKAVDLASPLLYNALVSGERMKSWRLDFYRIDPTGVEELYYRIAMEEALITSITAYMPNCLDPKTESFPHMEEVSFTYRRIMWEHVIGTRLSEDDWLVRR